MVELSKVVVRKEQTVELVREVDLVVKRMVVDQRLTHLRKRLVEVKERMWTLKTWKMMILWKWNRNMVDPH